MAAPGALNSHAPATHNSTACRRSSGVEQQFCKLRVAGSNPVAGSTILEPVSRGPIQPAAVQNAKGRKSVFEVPRQWRFCEALEPASQLGTNVETGTVALFTTVRTRIERW